MTPTKEQIKQAEKLQSLGKSNDFKWVITRPGSPVEYKNIGPWLKLTTHRQIGPY